MFRLCFGLFLICPHYVAMNTTSAKRIKANGPDDVIHSSHMIFLLFEVWALELSGTADATHLPRYRRRT